MQNYMQSDDVRALVHNGVIEKSYYVRAQAFFRNATAWNTWALRALLALGAGHVLAGIIFFFAFNWNDLSEFTKFGLVQGGMVISGLMWIGLKLDKPIAQAFGIALTVFIGIFLAVFGQVYQNPVAIYTPFIVWAILAFPLAFVSRSLAHWAVWLVIACIAASSFIQFNIDPIQGSATAIGALMSVSVCLFVCLGIYDYVQNKWDQWPSAAWFRLLLVTLIYGFCVTSLCIAIGESLEYLTIFALLIGGGVLSYLYVYPFEKIASLPLGRIACLVIGACGLAIMVAVIGFRIIIEIGDLLGGFLLGLLLMAGLTYCLARSFKHFSQKFKTTHQGGELLEKNTSILETNTHKTIVEFAEKFKASESGVLNEIEHNTEGQSPWYMEFFLGIAGMITSILAMGFLAVLLSQILNTNNEYPMIVLGLIVFGCALLLRVANNGLFARHFLNTIILGGGALATFGLGLLSSGGVPLILLTIVMSLIPMVVVKDRILEFLMACGISATCVYAVIHYNLPYPFTCFFVLCSVLGLLCFTRPIKMMVWRKQKMRIFDAAGIAFLLAPCIFASQFYSPDFSSVMKAGIANAWGERVVSICVTVIAIWYLNKFCLQKTRINPPVGICILLLIAIGFMPLGGAAALLVLLTGYILGIRSLAIIGVLAQIAFVVWYYYDLDVTLLHKSYLFMGFGAVLLIAYGFANKKGVEHA